jgi:hypothetical protein
MSPTDFLAAVEFDLQLAGLVSGRGRAGSDKGRQTKRPVCRP